MNETDFSDAPLPGNYATLANGWRMHYTQTGAVDGLPIVLLHGYPTWSYIWRNVARAVGAAGYRTIAPDLIGAGRSDTPRIGYSFDDHAAALSLFLDALNLTKIVLVVHDVGGPVGMRLVLRDPARIVALGILSTFGSQYRLPAPAKIPLLPELVGGAFNLFLTGFRAYVHDPATMSPAVYAHYKEVYDSYAARRILVRFPYMMWHNESDPRLAQQRQVEADIARLAIPMLIAWGENDRVFPIAKYGKFWRDLLPQAEFRSIPAANHYIQEDQPAAVAAAIVELARRTVTG